MTVLKRYIIPRRSCIFSLGIYQSHLGFELALLFEEMMVCIKYSKSTFDKSFPRWPNSFDFYIITAVCTTAREAKGLRGTYQGTHSTSQPSARLWRI